MASVKRTHLTRTVGASHPWFPLVTVSQCQTEQTANSALPHRPCFPGPSFSPCWSFLVHALSSVSALFLPKAFPARLGLATCDSISGERTWSLAGEGARVPDFFYLVTKKCLWSASKLTGTFGCPETDIR